MLVKQNIVLESEGVVCFLLCLMLRGGLPLELRIVFALSLFPNKQFIHT